MERNDAHADYQVRRDDDARRSNLHRMLEAGVDRAVDGCPHKDDGSAQHHNQARCQENRLNAGPQNTDGRARRSKPAIGPERRACADPENSSDDGSGEDSHAVDPESRL